MSSHHEPARKPDVDRYRLPGRGKNSSNKPNAEPARRLESPVMNSAMSACLKVCQDCAQCCLHTATHCMELGGVHASAHHQAVLHDCADVCETAARFIARQSPHFGRLCRDAAEIATLCAADCDALPDADTTMVHCAQRCRLCAESCLALTSHNGEG
jgi:hypothetical protein